MSAQPERVHVVLAGIPVLLEEMLRRRLAGCAELSSVDPGLGLDALSLELTARGAEILVLGGERPSTEAQGERLLPVHPGLVVLAVTQRGKETFLYRLLPFRVALGEVSSVELAGLIRGSMIRRPGIAKAADETDGGAGPPSTTGDDTTWPGC